MNIGAIRHQTISEIWIVPTTAWPVPGFSDGSAMAAKHIRNAATNVTPAQGTTGRFRPPGQEADQGSPHRRRRASNQ